MCLPSGNLSGDDRSGGSARGSERKRRKEGKKGKKGEAERERGIWEVIEDGRIQRGQRL